MVNISGRNHSLHLFGVEQRGQVAIFDSDTILGTSLFAVPRLNHSLVTAFEEVANMFVEAESEREVLQWKRLIKRADAKGQLRALVLGSSTSAGCGANWMARNAPRGVHGRCNFDYSWVRHWFARVSEALGAWVALRLDVNFKNAVGASHFGHCTSSIVASDTDIVLLDWAATAWESLGLLNRTLHTIRRSAPYALVVFVNWPRYASNENALEKLTLLSVEHGASSIMIDARNTSALAIKCTEVGAQDILRRSQNLSSACLRCPAKGVTCTSRSTESCLTHHRQRLKAGWSAFFADATHPNRAGHWLLGSASATFVIRRIHAARLRLNSSRPEHRNQLTDLRTSPPLMSAAEICLQSASDLPVKIPSAWVLVDDGVSKGVPKLGFASTTIGDEMVLALPSVAQLLLAPEACMGVVVTIGFLTSPRSEQGAISISCSGCACGPVGLTAGSFLMYSFPTFDTHIRSRAMQGLGGNISVTAEHSFLLGQHFGSACAVKLRHAPRRLKKRRSTVTSRVRVDSLYVRRANTWEERGLSNMQSSADYLRFRKSCK